MSIKYRTVKVIDVADWNQLVMKTYNKKYYNLQQQDGCMDRQQLYIEVPCEPEDYENDEIPEIINGSERGVSFKAWLATDCTKPLSGVLNNKLFWSRNFYPDITMLINDLHEKGLIEAGEYNIDIDW